MSFYKNIDKGRVHNKAAEAMARKAMLGQLDPNVAAAFEQTEKAISLCEDLVPQVAILQNDFNGFRKMLQHGGVRGALEFDLGKTGAADYLKGMHDVVKAALARRNGNPQPWAELTSKAAADMAGDVDARGGFAVPESYWPQLDRLLSAYGSVWGRCRRIPLGAGRTLKIPVEAVSPTAAWRVAQAATMTEMDLQLAQATLEPVLVGGFLDIADELLSVPEIDFGAQATASIVQAVGDALEAGLLQGEADGNPGDPPSNGLLIDAGVEDLSALATVSEALMVKFLTEAASHYPAFEKAPILVTTPGARWQLAGVRVAGTMSLLSDDLQRYAGIPLVTSPAMFETTHHVAVFNPQDAWVAQSGWRIDVNSAPRFKDYASTLRVLTHADWCFPLPARLMRAVVTNLS